MRYFAITKYYVICFDIKVEESVYAKGPNFSALNQAIIGEWLLINETGRWHLVISCRHTWNRGSGTERPDCELFLPQRASCPARLWTEKGKSVFANRKLIGLSYLGVGERGLRKSLSSAKIDRRWQGENICNEGLLLETFLKILFHQFFAGAEESYYSSQFQRHCTHKSNALISIHFCDILILIGSTPSKYFLFRLRGISWRLWNIPSLWTYSTPSRCHMSPMLTWF